MIPETSYRDPDAQRLAEAASRAIDDGLGAFIADRADLAPADLAAAIVRDFWGPLLGEPIAQAVDKLETLHGALRDARPYVYNRTTSHGDLTWREETARVVLARVDEALGKVTGQETYIESDDQRCGVQKDACACMLRAGHEGNHRCVHGTWLA